MGMILPNYETLAEDYRHEWFRRFIEDGDLDRCRLWLDKGFNPNASFYVAEGVVIPVLHHIIKKHILHPVFSLQKKLDMLSMMLEYGANPDLMSDDEMTPLMVAATRSFNENAIVRMLIDAGADPNAARPRTGGTAMSETLRQSNFGAFEMLLDAGGDPNAVTPLDGRSLLHMVAIRDDPKSIPLTRKALQMGANPNLLDKHGQTALAYANSTELVLELVQGGADPHLNSPLSQLGKNGHVLGFMALKALGSLKSADERFLNENINKADQASPLCCAMALGNPEIMRLHIQRDPEHSSLEARIEKLVEAHPEFAGYESYAMAQSWLSQQKVRALIGGLATTSRPSGSPSP